MQQLNTANALRIDIGGFGPNCADGSSVNRDLSSETKAHSPAAHTRRGVEARSAIACFQTSFLELGASTQE